MQQIGDLRSDFSTSRGGGQDGGRGRGRDRGRGRGQGRGRGRGRGRANEASELNIAGMIISDDEDDLVDNESCQEDMINDPLLDDDSYEEEDNLSQPPSTAFEPIDVNLLGSEQHALNFQFHPGNEQPYLSLQKFRLMSEIDIVLSIAEPFFCVLRECSNETPNSNLSMKDLYLYHAFLTLRTMHPLDTLESYWNTRDQIIRWSDGGTRLFQHLTITRYKHIRKNLRGYKGEDDIPSKSKGWKVIRAVCAVQTSFRAILTHPGEFLSADEGMARGSSCRNPIYVSLGKAKPLEGYRFFIFCDYHSKIIVNFMLDTKDLTSANCATRPGKFAGAIIDELCSVLPGRNYKVFADNYYNSVELAQHMLRNREILVCGTMQKKYTPPIVYFGNGKRPKPSRIHPKGALKIAKKGDADIYIYSWMDSAGVYFIDPAIGPGHAENITRKNVVGTRITFRVPSMIAMYNRYKHGVDVFDQIRKGFGCDLDHPTRKYTVRVFEILFSMILAQAYNIHRFIHKDDSQLKSQTQFKNSVICGFLNSSVVLQVQQYPTPPNHQLTQFNRGSRGGLNKST